MPDASARWSESGNRRAGRELSRAGPLLQSFIVSSMNSRDRHRVWVWLVCGLLFWLTANPPHCDLCDGISFTVASAQQSILKHSPPVAPDNCNGVCSCCGFHGLPHAGQVLIPANVELTGVAPEAARPAFAPRSTIFRPPRTVASWLTALRPWSGPNQY
jgi:hypothetical protein